MRSDKTRERGWYVGFGMAFARVRMLLLAVTYLLVRGVGIFDDPDKLVAQTWIPLIVLIGGVASAVGGYLLQYYASVVD